MRDDYKERIQVECDALSIKLRNLEVFIDDSPIFRKLDRTNQYLLVQQQFIMQSYLDILSTRLEIDT